MKFYTLASSHSLATLRIAFLLSTLLLTSSAHAQSSSLSLASASGVQGSSVSLNLSLNVTSGSGPAGVQWKLSYPSTDIVSLSATAGAALTAAGKTLNCNSAAGSITCLTSGMNSNALSSGVLAVLTANLATNAASSVSITMSDVMGALSNGSAATVSGSGGTLSVSQPTVSALQCSPSTVSSGGSSTCTVTLAAAAPSGGAAVTVSDNSTALTVPASVSVTAGTTTASFNATAGTVSANQAVTVTASLNGSSKTASVTVTPPGSSPTGITAAYSFDEGSGSTVTDLSGNSVTGTLQGATWSSGGKYAGAVSFNGSTSYIDLGMPSSLQTTGSMTWSAWVRAAANPPDDGQIIAQSDNASGWQFKTTPDTGVRTFGIAIGTNGSHTQRYSKTVLSLGIWYHVAAVYNAAAQTLDIYVNGALDNGGLVGTIPASTTLAAVNATIGKRSGGFYFNGLIDNLRVYNRALSASEIQVDMSTPVSASSGATPATVSALQCSPASVTSGVTSTCTVTLSKAAPTGGSSVAVSDNSTALTVPSSMTVAAGATTANFTATAGTVTANQAVTVTASLNGTSATASVTVQPAIISVSAAYAFDEGAGWTTADASGNGNTGQIRGATWTTAGKHGNTLSFNGINSSVDLGNPASLQSTGSMTWSAWIYATRTPYDDGQIIARSDNTSGWQLKTSPDTGVRTFGVAVSGTSSSRTQRYSKTVLSLNTWYYIAGVYNASAKTLDVYVNGILDNGVLKGTIPASQYLPAVNTTIGSRSGGYYFSGAIDDVRVYNRALSQAEIQKDMNTAVTAVSSTVMTSSLAPAAASKMLAATSSTTVAARDISGSSSSRDAVSALSCSPRKVNAGGQVTCQVRKVANAAASMIQVNSSSSEVQVPVIVAARANQSGLTFQASVDRTAKEQAVTVTATLDGVSVQDTILVIPSPTPILTVPDEQFARFGKQLSFQVAGQDPSDLPVQLMATDVPPGAFFNPLSGRFEWTPNSMQAGKYKVTFTATNVARQSSAAQVLINVDSGAPALIAADDFACSPGAIATLKGTWLADESTLSDPSGSSMGLGGTKVKVNGESAPLLFASPTRVSFLCPKLDAGAQLSISVETATASSKPLSTIMQAASPEIFILGGSDQNQGVVTFAGSRDTVTMRNSRIPGYPAQPGDEILIWGTGFGSATDPWAGLSVTIGGVAAQVASVRAVPDRPGVYVVQTRVPELPAPGQDVPVQVHIGAPGGKQVNSNTVVVAVEAIDE